MKLFFRSCVVLMSLSCMAQTVMNKTCVNDETAIKRLLGEIVQVRELGGVDATAEYYANDALLVSGDEGKRYTKSEYMSAMEKQDTSNATKLAAAPEEILIKFIDHIPVLTFIDNMKNEDRSTGIQYHGSFREARVFGCESGKWKIIFRSEIQRPNVSRRPVETEQPKLDEYVGHYRMVQEGNVLGDVNVTRKGDRLYEAWGKEAAEEILPGGHDTFFVRNDNTVEQFFRDEKNKVIGIHYILWDDHFEAHRTD